MAWFTLQNWRPCCIWYTH